MNLNSLSHDSDAPPSFNPAFELNFDKEAFENNMKDATSHLKDDFSYSTNKIEASFQSSSFDLDPVLTETRASFFAPSHI